MFSDRAIEVLGGKPWQSRDGSKRRIYFNNLHDFAGLKTSHYGTGSISYATRHGEKISNTAARKLDTQLRFGSIYWDAADDKFHGEKLTQDLFTEIVDEIRRRAKELEDK